MSRKWSVISSGHTPKKQIARKAFELALDREFRSVIRRAKDMAGQIEQPTDLWNLKHYLTRAARGSIAPTTIDTRFWLMCLGGWSGKGA
jgi:hypothetical protein